MSNIWEFLLQTLTVSLTALLLLLCKRLFQDKLPPIWQYGIWTVLALRILLPVQTGTTVLLPLPLHLETIKSMVESGLSSNYSSPWQPLSLHHVLPVYTALPHSITDWLFALYGVGVVLFLVRYLVGYIRLRHILRQGSPLTPALAELLTEVCNEHHLKPCQAVTLPGIHTAFVCGGLRPILVLPEEEWDAEHTKMVLLHELLHLRYRDGLASMFWCVLRCLHWCNPFLWWVFRQIENDMESLCDNRVLARLSSEDRRTYGNILLSMATERYPNAPGTSSIANGKKSITRRIEAITRFTKYPKGMEIVALCIALLLSFPVLAGTTTTYTEDSYTPETKYQLQRSLAMTRLSRCSTVAGALDTWAKGILYQNNIYLATVSPLDAQESYYQTISANCEKSYGTPYAPAYDKDFSNIITTDGYQLFQLTENEDGSYAIWVVFAIRNSADVGEDAVGKEGLGSLCIPVQVRYEDGWVVEEAGERIISVCDFDQVQYPGSPIEPIREWTYTGENGSVTLSEHVTYLVENTPGFGSADTLSPLPQLDAKFRYAVLHPHVTYTPTEEVRETMTYGFSIATLTESEEENSLPSFGYYTEEQAWESAKEATLESVTGASGSTNLGTGWAFETARQGEPLRSVYYGTGEYFYDIEAPIELPYGYAVQLTWGMTPMERITFCDNGITAEGVDS